MQAWQELHFVQAGSPGKEHKNSLAQWVGHSFTDRRDCQEVCGQIQFTRFFFAGHFIFLSTIEKSFHSSLAIIMKQIAVVIETCYINKQH